MKKLALLVLSCAVLPVFGQSDCWTNLSTQNSGIPSSSFNDIVEVDSGQFLIGTDNGLIQYDGSTFRFLSSQEFPLSNSKVNVIEVGNDGLYVGTDNGYTYVNSAMVSSVYLSGFTGLEGDSVRALAEDSFGNVWIGTEEGVSVKTGLNWSYLNGSVLPSSRVSAIIALADSSMLVATDQGLAHVTGTLGNYTVTTYTKQGTSNGLINDNIQSLYQTNDGHWWVGTLVGISEYDGSAWTKYTVANTIGLASNDARDFHQDVNGNLHIATAFGLTSIDASGAVSHTYSADGLAENLLSAVIYSSTDSNLYIVSNNQISGNNNGLHIYDGSSFENYERENTGMPTNQPLHLLANGTEMLTGFSAGIYQRGPSGIIQLSTSNTNLSNNSIRDLSTDNNGNVWAVTNSGMSKWDGSHWVNYANGSNGLPSSSFIGQGITDSTFIVSNTFSSGVVYYDGNSTTAYKSFNTTGLSSNTHHDFQLLPNGDVAIATESGLSIFDGTSFTLYQTSSGLANNKVKSLTYDSSSGALWMGYKAGSNGIASMNPVTGTITNFSGASVSGNINDITSASDSIIYFTAGSNVYRFDAKNDSLYTYNSANSPISSTVINDVEYLNSQLWIATGSRLHVIDDFERPAVAITVGDPSTCDLDSVIIASVGNYSSIQWNSGQSSTFISTDTTTSTSYYATDANGCVYYSNTVNVEIFPNPIADLFLSNDTSFCLGESNTISTWDYFDTYSWNNGNTGDSVFAVDNGTFWVEVMDTNGCFATSDTITLEVWKPYELDSICIVTVDSANHNQIIWNKTTGQRTYQYGIYKENPTTGSFDLLTVQDASGVLSVYSDVNSNAGVTSSRYAISVIDSCGNESQLSLPHETMHLTINEGINSEVNLIWDGYEGIPVVTYEIWRGSSPKQMFKIDDVPAANFTYTDLNAPVGLLFYKIVVVNPYICNPTVGKNSETDNYGTTESNVVDYALTDNVIIYPNPFKGQTRVVWSNPDLDSYEIKVYDAVGRLVLYEASIAQTSYDLYQNDLPPGVYAIELTDGERLLKTDFIIE